MKRIDYRDSTKIKEIFVDKTIKKIISNACNCWIFHFTDGTSVELFAEVHTQLPFLEIYLE